MNAVDPNIAALLTRVAALETQVEALNRRKAIPAVDTLGAFGNAGRIVYLTTDGKIYRDTGAAWKSTEIA